MTELEASVSIASAKGYLEFVVFVAGSASDPRPIENELEKHFARDLDCNRIVHYSVIAKKWVYDDGTFHTGCRLEFSAAWLPRGYAMSQFVWDQSLKWCEIRRTEARP